MESNEETNRREKIKGKKRQRGRESNGRGKRKYQETKKRPVWKWKIEDASTGKMTVKIRRENSRMTYQRIQRENGETETLNAEGKCWRLQKRGKKREGIKDAEVERCRAEYLTFTRDCLTSNSQTRFLYYTNKVEPVGRSYLALNAECECEVKDK